ncbi:MAG: CIA30 family protein, partial [Henriciella sp.]|nr:CIA30 family protein [Henriciella sp.]
MHKWILGFCFALSLTGVSMAQTCQTIIEHSAEDETNPWRTINDGVMGGLSDGGSFLQEDHLSFVGNTNTNGGHLL